MFMENEANLSAVELVDRLILEAIAQGASDIHVESQPDGLRIRFRLDGMLHEQPSLPASIMMQILSRIKVLACVDVAQKRIPQDGKFSITMNDRPIDLRVSTFPAHTGEKIVIRILDTAKPVVSLHQLGFADAVLVTFNQLLQKPQGFILVTGPTGSGKTTTLYAAISALNKTSTHIITLEDPVEYHIPGVTQAQINPLAGFTFAKGIRSLLRQDPDIAMIGEIRDKESARIAIEAALTGHLVLSTLHTNNAVSAIIRLMDMGIEPFLINAAVTGVLAQRLVRIVCERCRQEKNIDEQDRSCIERYVLNIEKLYYGTGCHFCNGIGYRGRTGVFELLTISDDLRALIIEHPKFDAMYKQALADGMQTLQEHGKQKVAEGITTLEELLRIL